MYEVSKEFVINFLLVKGVFKVEDGRQLYELSEEELFELYKKTIKRE